jgi:hypothetical protein
MRLCCFDGGLEGFDQFLGRARFAEETEDAALVDGVHGGGLVDIAREHDTNDIGRHLAGFGQELDAAHLRHAHVGHNHRVIAPVYQGGQAGQRAKGGLDLELLAHLALDGGKHVGIIIHEKYFFHAASPWVSRVESG